MRRGKEERKEGRPLPQPALKASAILETVPKDKAFYFFTEVGSYTGCFSSSIKEFRDAIKTIDLRSLEFHTARGDFENWVGEVLKDNELALKMSEIRKANPSGEELRKRLYETVSARYDQLVALAGKPS